MLTRSQFEQLCAAQYGLQSGYGLAHEQRLFLPVPAHELRGAQAGEKR
jgi:hypothetical protein